MWYKDYESHFFSFELPSAEHDGNDNSKWFDSRPEEPFNPLKVRAQTFFTFDKIFFAHARKVFTHEQIMSGLRNAISNWKKSRFGAEWELETRTKKTRKRGNTVPISPKLATRVSFCQIFRITRHLEATGQNKARDRGRETPERTIS